MPVGVAAGHPATAEVGLRTLAAGGTAADAAVAAVLACCVAESVLTGIAGGGFAMYYRAASHEVTCLDFFCSVPGLGGDRTPSPMVPIEVAFGGVPLSYQIGEASVAVPGVPAGLGEVYRRWGRLPWHELVAPAVDLARSGVVLPHEQARTLISISEAMLPGFGASVYSPNGRLVEGGDLIYHPGLDLALATLAEEGPGAFYTGWVGELMAETVQAGGGVLSEADLVAYRVRELPVYRATLAGRTVLARRDLNDTIGTLAALPVDLADRPRPARAVALADALRVRGGQRLGDTTNISVMDGEGNACVITVTLGLGSGVWLPGLGVHLNSMLGEGELITGDPVPGKRMGSMMCPLVVVDADGRLELGAGSAGASRIRTALLHTLVNVLVDDLDMVRSIARPRFHVVDEVVHVEGGYEEDELSGLAAAGYKVNRWQRIDHYFGGTSGVGRAGAAGDPRRGGAGLFLRQLA